MLCFFFYSISYTVFFITNVPVPNQETIYCGSPLNCFLRRQKPIIGMVTLYYYYWDNNSLSLVEEFSEISQSFCFKCI